VPDGRRAAASSWCAADAVKFACACGHVIRDQTDSLPYKARLIPDADDEALWDGIEACAARYAAALRDASAFAAWRREVYPHRDVPGLTPESVLSDCCTGLFVRYSRVVYQCEGCARLWVRTSDDRSPFGFLPFRSEDVDGHGVLAPTEPVPPPGAGPAD
jgi:hypothetical protein